MTVKTWHLKTYEMQQKQSSEGSVQQYTLPQAILPQETRKTLNRLPNFTLKITGKRTTKNPQNQYKERNHKYQSRNN